MNNLEKLQKLYADKVIIKVPSKPKEGEEQLDFEINLLSMDDMALFGSISQENTNPEESAKVMKKIMAKSLGVSEEEVSKISVAYVTDLMNQIMEQNNMSGEEQAKTDKIKDLLNQRLEQPPKDISNPKPIN